MTTAAEKNDKSAQPCGCDAGANWTCEYHQLANQVKYTGPGYSEPGIAPAKGAFAQAVAMRVKDLDKKDVPAREYGIKDEGEKLVSSSGVLRNVVAHKIDFLNILHGPMLKRWAAHLTKAKKMYPDVAIGVPNWTQAKTLEDIQRFRESALRHMLQWLAGDVDEDHAAAIFFNINGVEHTKDKLNAPVAAQPGAVQLRDHGALPDISGPVGSGG